MKYKALTLLLMGSLSMAALQGCKKDKAEDVDSDLRTTEDNALVEGVFNDVFDEVDDGAKANKGLNKKDEETAILSGCATVTADTTSNPKVLTIDFGTGCVGKDGRTRKGKVIATFNGRYRTKGTVITVTLDNYYVNTLKDLSYFHKVEGMKTIENLGANSKGNSEFKIKVTGAKVTTQNGVISWDSERTREWVAGASTPFNILDDAYEVRGSITGTSAAGQKYTVNITKPLRAQVGCKYLTSGTIDVKPEGKLTRTVDYGNGDCDNAATVTIANRTYPITLR